ncbi:hypothetical protein [Fodinibius saliphilus]|uniref:hypothetical protein n=1 Tax=Fodinibius saliphilus TaxID=1920650 RepID=UPI0011095865|nr:hypothetical protein [Fodinibius saliphilus]
MPNEDNDCIRYLMKEMDPSEELLMEQAMMEDEDLLIEVESMRQTLQKLNKLPEMDPPSDVTDAIMQKAAEQAEKNRKSQKTFKPVLQYAVAATLALTVTAGGMWFYIGSEGKQNTSSQEKNISSTASSANVSTDIGGMQLSRVGNEATQKNINNRSKPKIKPWTDRNDILRYEDQFMNQNGQYQALIKNATQKLRLIERPTGGTGRVNSLQLTGSGN